MDKSETDNLNVKEITEQTQEAVGMYKSEFLIKKVTLQNEKKKKERLAKAGNQRGEQKDTKPNAKKAKSATEIEEGLLEYTKELKSDIKIREEEQREQSEANESFLKQNQLLKQQIQEQKLQRIKVESKLNRIVTLKELDANFSLIENYT